MSISDETEEMTGFDYDFDFDFCYDSGRTSDESDVGGHRFVALHLHDFDCDGAIPSCCVECGSDFDSYNACGGANVCLDLDPAVGETDLLVAECQ